MPHEDTRVCEVTFPAASTYYQQKTTAGNPFGSLAVLEGRSTLAFFYLWPCQYIKTQQTCSFCFQVKADMADFNLPALCPGKWLKLSAGPSQTQESKKFKLTAGTLFATQAGRH